MGPLQAHVHPLILDNCEHLIARCAELVATPVQACPRLRVLATSREEFGLSGETTWRLDPLAVPGPADEASDVGALDQYEAVRHFIERARTARRDLRIDAASAPAIADICVRLDGIPLALELAAAQLRYMGQDELRSPLAPSPNFLRASRRDTADRQRTPEDLVARSWRLLDDRDRRAWAGLSLSRSGVGLGAAEAFLGLEAGALLEALVAKSSLRPVETGRGTR